MTEENAAHEQPSDPTDETVEDPRFEVKWRKKEASSPAPTGPVGTEESSTLADTAELQQQLIDERERVKELQDRWHRAQADLANLRRRTEQEKGEVEKFASMLLVAELLPVLDNFERAMATVPGNLRMLSWIQGIDLIERHLSAILERQGLSAIEAQGQPFSPHFHEAVSEREAEGVAPGTVLQEYQKGYTMHGRVIRPALVELAKEPAPAEKPDDRTDDDPTPVDTTAGDTSVEETTSENIGP